MDNLAIVFAGQGAQFPGMGKNLYDTSEAARNVFLTADNIRPGTSELCFYGTSEELAKTDNTQPAVFVVSMAHAAKIRESGINAAAAAGFSLGEISALCYSGIISFPDAFKLVCMRSTFMQECVSKRQGSMAAVMKLDNNQVFDMCKLFDEVYPVNYNCPGQIVVAGDSFQIDSFISFVSKNNGRAIKLPVGGAFHTTYMADACYKLYGYLAKVNINRSKIPVYSNVTAEPYPTTYAEIVAQLAHQVMSPVLWQLSIENMIKNGCNKFIEAGPGKTLSGFIRKIDPNVTVLDE